MVDHGQRLAVISLAANILVVIRNVSYFACVALQDRSTAEQGKQTCTFRNSQHSKHASHGHGHGHAMCCLRALQPTQMPDSYVQALKGCRQRLLMLGKPLISQSGWVLAAPSKRLTQSAIVLPNVSKLPNALCE